MPAIIGSTVGAMIVFGVLLFVYFRRKNRARGGGGVGLWERKRYHKPGLDYSPDGSQAPFTHHNQNHVQPTPFVLPSTQSNAALSYYGDSSTSSSKNTSSQYPTSTAALVPTQYQQAPEGRQWREGSGQQSGFAYPPPSSVSSVYPPSAPHSAMTPPEQRASYYTENATHLGPQGTPMTSRTSVYNDGPSRHSTYTVQNPPSQRASVSAAARKAAEAQLEREDPPRNQQSPPVGAGVQVYQHQDAGSVIELPPAYREISQTAPPPS